jgi:hypothetical protein
VIAIGSKDACAAAKKIIEDKVANLLKTITKTIDMDSKYFSSFRSNQFLRNIESDNNVRVSLRNEDNNIVLRGPSDGVDAAVEILTKKAEFLENSLTKEFEVETGDIPSILGQGGSNIQKVCKDNNVTIDIPDRKKRAEGATSVVIKVIGLDEDCDAAIVALEALVPVAVKIVVPTTLHRYLIVDEENGVRAIRSKFNVNVDVPNRNGGDIVTIRGKAENVEEAKAFLEEVLGRNFILTISVDQKYHKDIIGQRGANVNKLRKEHDVKIELTQKSDDIAIIGAEENCNACAATIKASVAEMDSFVTKEAEIHASVHGKIIGARGANIRELQGKYKVKIDFPRERTSEVISVTGPEDGVDDCIDELYQIQEENEDLIEDALQMESFVKPTRQAEPQEKPKTGKFKVANAPWEGPDVVASFPTLGSNTSSNLQGVWANRN